jgi:hypothetical protein
VIVASPAAALLLLLVTAIVAATAKALVVWAVRAVSVLAGTGITAHAIRVTAVKTVALEVARVAAIATDVLRWRETALGSGGISSWSRAGTAEGRRGTRSSLGVTERRLQVISNGVARLAGAVEWLALSLEWGSTPGKAVVDAAERAGTKTWLASSLAGSNTTVITQTRCSQTTVAVEGRLTESSGRWAVVIRCVRGHLVGLAVHATLSIWAKSSLAISRVILVVVGVTIVGMVVTGILLAVWLGLRSLARLLLLLTRLLSLLLLSLGSRVGSAVATVLGIHSTSTKSWLVVQTTLGILAEIIRLRSSIAAKLSLRGSGLLALSSLLAKLLTVVVVGVSVGLVRGVVGSIVVRRRAESGARLLCLRGLGREVVEGGLRRGGALLVERIQRLLSYHGVLGTSLTKATVLLSAWDGSLARDLSLGLGLSSRNSRGRNRSNRRSRLLSKWVGNTSLGSRRKRGARMSDRWVSWRLGSGLRLLSLTINIFIPVQTESSELNGGTVNLTVAGHTHSFLLVKNASLVVARDTGSSLSSGLGGSCGESARRGLMLLLGSRDGCSINTGRVLFKIWFGELILGGRKSDLRLYINLRNFGGNSGVGNGRGLVSFVGGSRGGFGLGLGHSLRLGFDRFGGRLRLSRLSSWLGSGGSFLGLGRGLGRSRLSQHACPGLDCRSSRLGCLSRGGGRLFSNGLLFLWGAHLGILSAPDRWLLCGNRQGSVLLRSSAVGGSSSRSATCATTSSFSSSASTSTSFRCTSATTSGSGPSGRRVVRRSRSLVLSLSSSGLLRLWNFTPLRNGTLSDACDGFVLVAVGFLESKKDIGLRPVGEHLADHRSLVAILLSKLAKIAFIFECTLGISSAVVGLVAIGSSAAATGETSSTTAARASAARGGCPWSRFGH